MEKIKFEDFINQPTEKSNWDSAVMESLMKRNILLQFIDIWGEANKVVQFYTAKKIDSIPKQLIAFQNVCNLVYQNTDLDENVKRELKIAEWELYDFCLWENSFQNDSNSVMRWFNQWCYDINYDLLSNVENLN